MSALELASGLLDKLEADEATFEALGAFIKAVWDHIEFEEMQVWPRLHALLPRRDDRRTGPQDHRPGGTRAQSTDQGREDLPEAP